MTFLDKIKPHLISDDFLIQETVLHAIHDYPLIPEDWTLQLLKEAFNNNITRDIILIYIDNQPINEEALNVLTEHIPMMDKTKVHLAIKLLDNVDPSLALKYRDKLAKYITKDMWNLYELIINGTEEEVYTEYGKTLNSFDQAKPFQYNLYVKSKKLADCIVKNGWITEEEISYVILEEMNEDWFSLNGILNVYMLGLLKLEKYIPTLASLLIRDDDLLLEEVSAALIGFQTDEVVRAVEPYLKNDTALIYAASVLENIKSELSVRVLRDAYLEAEELEDQDLLFEALCHQLSETALPEISSHMNKEYFSSIIDIEQTVYGYYAILGLTHPDLDFWRQTAMDVEMNFRDKSKQESLLFNAPIRNDHKIGRNDPCPCGSGKKYKKCCGK